jgi:hypothetical protein
MAGPRPGHRRGHRARVENNQTSTNGGDRHLHYNATTREVASRQSVLDALALEDMLHRPAMAGG